MTRISFARLAVALTVLPALLQIPCLADNNRLMLANQFDYPGNRGYYVDLENSASNYGGVQPLSSLAIAFGVADGGHWRYIVKTPGWRYNHEYHVKAEITNSTATLTLDGQPVGTSDGAFTSETKDGFTCNQAPSWAVAQTQYWLVEKSITIRSGEKTLYVHQFPATDAQIDGGMLEPRRSFTTKPLPFEPGKPLTVEAVFTIVDRAGREPLVDKYGQYRIGKWANKIRTDADLKAATVAERKKLTAMPDPTGRDAYGGSRDASWKQAATGYFTVTRRLGFWWLVSPAGNPCFYTGMDNPEYGADNGTLVDGREKLFAQLPPKTGLFAPAYVTGLGNDAGPTGYFSFPIANNIIRYGGSWAAPAESLTRLRLRKWAFSGKGKWAKASDIPYINVLNYDSKLTVDGAKPDVFDPKVIAGLRADLEAKMAAGIHDHYLLGWSVGNEYGEIVQWSTCAAALRETTAIPAKQALVDYALKSLYHGDAGALASAWGLATPTAPAELYTAAIVNVPSKDQESLREYYEDTYYRVLYETVKGIDPNHLYLGDWVVPNWWVNKSDWALVAAHCDIVGYDMYGNRFGDSSVPALAQASGKPILCGEFGFPPTYLGARGVPQWTAASVDTDADEGTAYKRWLTDAVANPYCVGVCFFEYRDEPVTGRGPGLGQGLVYGENMAFGTVDVADQPKWDLVNAMVAINRKATDLRIKANAATHH